MNTDQRIAKNTGVLLVSRIVSYIIGFFFIIQTLRKFDQNASQQTLRKFDHQTFRKNSIKNVSTAFRKNVDEKNCEDIMK